MSNTGPNLKKLLPRGMAIKYCALPVRRKGRVLLIAMPDPTNDLHREDIENFTGFKIEALQKDCGELIDAIRDLYKLDEDEYAAMKNRQDLGSDQFMIQSDHDPVETIKLDYEHDGFLGPPLDPTPQKTIISAMEPGASTVELINGTLNRGLELEAQEIQLDLSANELNIRYRIEGNLQTDLTLPKLPGEQFCRKILSMAGLDSSTGLHSGYGVITQEVGDRVIRFHLRYRKSLFGEAINIQVCDSKAIGSGLGQLGVGHPEEQFLIKATRRPNGLILCASPPRHGKTLTMLSLLRSFNLENKIVVVAADTVEYPLPDIQYFVPSANGLTYQQTATFLLKSGVDVLCFEEIDEDDKAQAALKSGLAMPTLATIRGRECVQALVNLPLTVRREFDLRGLDITIICQRLVSKLCDRCKQQTENAQQDLRKLGISATDMNDAVSYEAVGCKFCNFTGFNKYCGLFQTMVVSDEIKQLLDNRGSISELRKLALDQGMTSMKELGIELVTAGLTTADEVLSGLSSLEE